MADKWRDGIHKEHVAGRGDTYHNPSIWEVKTQGEKVQGLPGLHMWTTGELEYCVSLGAHSSF